MPTAVREAVIEAFASRESRADAEAMLAAMEKSGRYVQETW